MSLPNAGSAASQRPMRLPIWRTLWTAFRAMWRYQKWAYLTGFPFLLAMLAVQVTIATSNPIDESFFWLVSIAEIAAYNLAMAGLALAAFRFCLVRLFPAPSVTRPDLLRFFLAYGLLGALPNFVFWELLRNSSEFPELRNTIMLATLSAIAILHVLFGIALPANANGDSTNAIQAIQRTRGNVSRIGLMYLCVMLWFTVGLIFLTVVQIFGARLFRGPPAFELPRSEQIALEHWPAIMGMLATFPVQVWLAFFPCAVVTAVYRQLERHSNKKTRIAAGLSIA